jgi:hypothetical protein
LVARRLKSAQLVAGRAISLSFHLAKAHFFSEDGRGVAAAEG